MRAPMRKSGTSCSHTSKIVQDRLAERVELSIYFRLSGFPSSLLRTCSHSRCSQNTYLVWFPWSIRAKYKHSLRQRCPITLSIQVFDKKTYYTCKPRTEDSAKLRLTAIWQYLGIFSGGPLVSDPRLIPHYQPALTIFGRCRLAIFNRYDRLLPNIVPRFQQQHGRLAFNKTKKSLRLFEVEKNRISD